MKIDKLKIIFISTLVVINFAFSGIAQAMTVMTDNELKSTACGTIIQSVETDPEVSLSFNGELLPENGSSMANKIEETSQSNTKKESDFITHTSHTSGISIGFYNINLDIYIKCITYGDTN